MAWRKTTVNPVRYQSCTKPSINCKGASLYWIGSLLSHSWWRHQMETFSAVLAICAGNSPVPGEFPAQRPVTRSFDVLFDLRPNKRLSKQSWGWWFETLSRPFWRHRNVIIHLPILPSYRPELPQLLQITKISKENSNSIAKKQISTISRPNIWLLFV